MRISLILLAAFLMTGLASATDLNGPQRARYQQLTGDLRCLICQNRSIADSDAPLAKDLRHIVARQIAQGRTDAQIKQYLVDRYGQWVLYDPPFEFATWLLWLGPFALLLVGLIMALTIVRKRRDAPRRHAELDRARLARVLGETDKPINRPRKDHS
ncbi:MAG: cytochrome c-type biogenesis protein CcmH [Salinisphaera sp.]|jgi:cytochrome c-type biogenesis protein CcmH|nr:cytochrome c-type biogenesis protein CcmH [Salinisphaera sp.]